MQQSLPIWFLGRTTVVFPSGFYSLVYWILWSFFVHKSQKKRHCMAISIGRVFQLLDLLQSRSLLPAAELMERLEIDGRSLRRSISQLQGMGIPIESVRGRYG